MAAVCGSAAGSGLFQEEHEPCHTANADQEWSRKFPDLNLIKHLWNVLNKQAWSMWAPLCNVHDTKDLLHLSTQYSTHEVLWSSRLKESVVLTAQGEYAGGFKVMDDESNCQTYIQHRTPNTQSHKPTQSHN